MKYIDKIRKSDKIYSLVKSLEYGDKLTVIYGADKYGTVRKFDIENYNSINKDRPSYGIKEAGTLLGASMNIEHVTKTQLKAYSFDMMKQKTTYNFPIYKMDFFKIERKLKGEEYYPPTK